MSRNAIKADYWIFLIKEVFCSPVSQSRHPTDVWAINDVQQSSLIFMGLMVGNSKTFNTAKFNLNEFQSWLCIVYPMYLLKTHVITDGRGDTVVIIKPLEAVMTVGGLVLREQGGDVGGVHHQHVPGQDLLLGHDVTTLGLGELHLKQEAGVKIDNLSSESKMTNLEGF